MTLMRDLRRQDWQSPELQRWLKKLQQEYGEQGSAASSCDSTHAMMKIYH